MNNIKYTFIDKTKQNLKHLSKNICFIIDDCDKLLLLLNVHIYFIAFNLIPLVSCTICLFEQITIFALD